MPRGIYKRKKGKASGIPLDAIPDRPAKKSWSRKPIDPAIELIKIAVRMLEQRKGN